MAMVIETVADVGVIDPCEQGEHGLLMGRQSIEEGHCYDPCRLRRGWSCMRRSAVMPVGPIAGVVGAVVGIDQALLHRRCWPSA
jgi:hypothetical protein